MNRTIKLHGNSYLLKELDRDNKSKVLSLFNSCDDYFYLVEGEKATEENV